MELLTFADFSSWKITVNACHHVVEEGKQFYNMVRVFLLNRGRIIRSFIKFKFCQNLEPDQWPTGSWSCTFCRWPFLGKPQIQSFARNWRSSEWTPSFREISTLLKCSEWESEEENEGKIMWRGFCTVWSLFLRLDSWVTRGWLLGKHPPAHRFFSLAVLTYV